MTTPGRIFYACPPVPRPSGGVRVLWQHVELLCEAGFDAVLWLPGPVREQWFDSDAPVRHGPTVDLAADDLLVVPEVPVAPGQDPAPGARKVLFNQGHFFTYAAWPGDVPGYPGWEPLPAVWAVSHESVNVLSRLHPDMPPMRIPNYIDTEVFRPGERTAPSIAWMPRKRPLEGSLLRELLRADPRTEGVELREIDGLAAQEVAALLATTTVFVSLSHTDSFGLPVAEALASGCLVVGYSGGGGTEMFEAPASWPVPEQRPVLLAEKALEVLGFATHDLAMANRRWLTETYSRETTGRALTEAVWAAFARPGVAARATHPVRRVDQIPASIHFSA